jgi:arsenate reductase (thioredoxin)
MTGRVEPDADPNNECQMPVSPPPDGRPARILFLCVANSARSQLAEGIARARFGEAAIVESAGSAPRFVHPLASQVLDELGIEHANQCSKSVDDIDTTGVDLVVTLCADEVCPVAVAGQRLHWPLPDPAEGPAGGAESELLTKFRETSEAISARVDALAKQWLGAR